MQMRYLSAARKMPIFLILQTLQRTGRGKIFIGSKRVQKIILNQTQPILVLASVKSFSC